MDHDEEDLRAIYAKYKKEFSAADLQKYTEIEEGIPVEQVIAECEAIQRGAAARSSERTGGATMSEVSNGPVAKPESDEDLRAIYAQYKKEFSAADLQKYTEVDEEYVSSERLLADLEAIHRQETEKRQKA
ncbi:MAG: hypothetical protein JNM56_20075 [Planctomycetia bacterium]|nr:hypothetical protein [Planctomycetia bacterium]